MTDIKAPIPILKDPKIVDIWEQKDTHSSTVNDDSATKALNVIKVELTTIGILKEVTLVELGFN